MTDVLLSRLAAPLLIVFALTGCSIFDTPEKAPDPSTIPVDTLYSTGVDQMNTKNYTGAGKTFKDLEQALE